MTNDQPYYQPPAPIPQAGQHQAGPYPGAAQPAGTQQPGMYSPPPYPAAPHAPGYAARPTSGLAITSLVCGIAGLVLAWLIVPFLASVAAIVTGHMALGQMKRRPDLAGKGMAVTGLILGYVAVGLAVIGILGAALLLATTGVAILPFLFTN
ncbi:DUF4190 domain-containing protein [Microbacterium sp.]|uniref:DUF4190 domain-containing protein n=1 Tax=Microbacterium sp. TaxID=51671 RepID=UPI002810B4E7|nr:DUF4190 domain-containing protein [Microbacterium sp.]